MANYNSNYTGAQIDAAVARAAAIPDPTGHLNGVLTHKTTGEEWSKVAAGSIDSGVATNGQLLTADGTGGASWGYSLWTGTQAQYEAISPKDNNTLYITTD